MVGKFYSRIPLGLLALLSIVLLSNCGPKEPVLGLGSKVKLSVTAISQNRGIVLRVAPNQNALSLIMDDVQVTSGKTTTLKAPSSLNGGISVRLSEASQPVRIDIRGYVTPNSDGGGQIEVEINKAKSMLPKLVGSPDVARCFILEPQGDRIDLNWQVGVQASDPAGTSATLSSIEFTAGDLLDLNIALRDCVNLSI